MKTNASDAPLVLQVRGLRKRFTLHLREGLHLDVLHGVDLSVHEGECVALVGASGQGKSTLMKCLTGAYGIDAGQALVHDGAGWTDLAGADAWSVMALRRRTIAHVSQFLRAVPRVAALDVVAERVMQADRRLDVADADDALWDDALAQARERAAALLRRLNLPPALWGLPPATFSGGEQQRVNIARGFAVPARLLLLDEPTASLDAANRRVVVRMIEEAKAAGAAVVGIFHDEEVRDAVADRRVELPRALDPEELSA
jgi:alpha-D-ribose 1-methylphosphonate 5-triphosphate synthase subunit PhnL